MSQPEFQVAFGVKASEVFNSLEVVGVEIDTDEVYLVDEDIFCGMYSGRGECAEWLGLGLYYLDEDDTFIDITAMDYSDNPARQTQHYQEYTKKLTDLLEWLKDNGYVFEGELQLPEPTYFIACGTD